MAYAPRHYRSPVRYLLDKTIDALCGYVALFCILAVAAALVLGSGNALAALLTQVWRARGLAVWAVNAGQRTSGALLSGATTVWCVTAGLGCSRPAAPALQQAAHRVRHAATVSLDVFESFAQSSALDQPLSFVECATLFSFFILLCGGTRADDIAAFGRWRTK